MNINARRNVTTHPSLNACYNVSSILLESLGDFGYDEIFMRGSDLLFDQTISEVQG